ncbi:MAG: fimbrial chaperone [Acinetobacter sp.]
MNGRLPKIFLTVGLLMFVTLAKAGIIVGGTRLLYNSDKPDATISVVNKDSTTPHLIQVWVDPFSKDDKTKPPFTAIPPVSRLDAQQEKVLRIIKTQGALPQDRESVFWLNIKDIPPSPKNKNVSRLEIAIKTRIKLFWRPESIKLIPEQAALQLKWHRQGGSIIVENPTPIHISIMNVTVDGKDVPLNMINPFETLTLPLPAGVSGSSLVWRFINDYGAISKDIKQAL